MAAPPQQAGQPSLHVFTYGSLMFAPVWERVVQGRYRSLPAQLQGYVRLVVRGVSYPGIVEREGAKVDGLLYLDVVAADLDRLDRFEGSEYARRDLVVSLPDGSQTTAAAYGLPPMSTCFPPGSTCTYGMLPASIAPPFWREMPGVNAAQTRAPTIHAIIPHCVSSLRLPCPPPTLQL